MYHGLSVNQNGSIIFSKKKTMGIIEKGDFENTAQFSRVNKLGLEKAEESEIKLPTNAGFLENQESSRKTSISDLLTMPNL